MPELGAPRVGRCRAAARGETRLFPVGAARRSTEGRGGDRWGDTWSLHRRPAPAGLQLSPAWAGSVRCSWAGEEAFALTEGADSSSSMAEDPACRGPEVAGTPTTQGGSGDRSLGAGLLLASPGHQAEPLVPSATPPPRQIPGSLHGSPQGHFVPLMKSCRRTIQPGSQAQQ